MPGHRTESEARQQEGRESGEGPWSVVTTHHDRGPSVVFRPPLPRGLPWPFAAEPGNVRMAKVFISYRRSDARQDAGRLSDALVREFGEENVFMDLSSLVPGQSFLAEIDEAIDTSDVVLVVIGRQWLTIAGEDGRRRLDDADDPVRLEVAAGMARAR